MSKLAQAPILLLDPEDEGFRGRSWPVIRESGECVGWRVYIENDNKRWLHRVITDAPHGKMVDHANGDTSDNRRHNLRVCTRAQNKRNCKRHARRVEATPYKGVYVVRGRFRAIIRHSGRNHHLGYFDSPEMAARAYDRVALDVFGAFACLNFPPSGGRCAQVRS